MEIAITSIILSAIWATVFYIYKKSVENVQETLKEANELIIKNKIRKLEIEKDEYKLAMRLICDNETRITEKERHNLIFSWNQRFKAEKEMNNHIFETLSK